MMGGKDLFDLCNAKLAALPPKPSATPCPNITLQLLVQQLTAPLQGRPPTKGTHLATKWDGVSCAAPK